MAMYRSIRIDNENVDLFNISNDIEKLGDNSYRLGLFENDGIYNLLDVIQDDYSFLELHLNLSDDSVTVCTYCENSDDNEDISIIGVELEKLINKAKKKIKKL